MTHDDAIGDAQRAFEERRFEDGRRSLVGAGDACLDGDDDGLDAFVHDVSRLVASCWSEGLLDELRPALERIAVAALARKPAHAVTPRLLSCLGWSFAWSGDHLSAEPLFARALALRLQNGAPALERAHAFADLAESRCARGDREGSAPLLERALALLEREQPEGLVLARVAHLLATIETHRGAYERADALYARTITIRESRLRFDHPTLARASAERAEVLLCLGRTEEAENAARRALAILERSRPATDPELARCRALVETFESA